MSRFASAIDAAAKIAGTLKALSFWLEKRDLPAGCHDMIAESAELAESISGKIIDAEFEHSIERIEELYSLKASGVMTRNSVARVSLARICHALEQIADKDAGTLPACAMVRRQVIGEALAIVRHEMEFTQ